jgi:polyphosphate kinase
MAFIMNDIDLNQTELYINRDMSLLEFNVRVLAQARDESVPLLERLRYLCISSTNLDEFFEVRVAALIQKANLGTPLTEKDDVPPQELLKTLRERSCELVQEQYRILNELMLPQLAEEDIRFIRRSDWSESQEKWLHKYYEEELLPILSPMGLDPAHPFPRVLNKSLNFIVSLTGKDAFGRNSGMAIVQAPRALPRLIQLPPEEPGNGPHDFVFLSSVIHAYVDELFHGMKAKGCYQFRVTRNSDLYVDEEAIDDLLHAVKGELTSRHYGDTVRLEITDECPDDMLEFILARFHLTQDQIFQVNGPVNLNRLQAVCDIIDRPDLKFPVFLPKLPATLKRSQIIFNAIKKQDILLHHPFESFAPVVDLLRQAARDPDVLSIKQTLYRTGPNSAIVNALAEAANAGKEVTVVVELRARFDEEANVSLADRLQEVGAHVLYGIVGYKTHAKMMVIVRREGKHLRHYVHLGTGNYHASTARVYTDYGLLTCDKTIGEDVQKVFNQLTSLGKVIKLNKLLQSPFTLFDGMLSMIKREISHAEAGKPARIIAKMNGLIEPQIIQALYQASMAGVQIDLIVRGICGLRPGVPGVSENIRVRSIIGRFLEHTRVFYFGNDGNPDVFAGSADWMERNLFKRVETCFPIERKKLKGRVIQELEYYLQDNTQAWLLQEDGSYRLAPRGDAEPVSAQQTLLDTLAI